MPARPAASSYDACGQKEKQTLRFRLTGQAAKPHSGCAAGANAQAEALFNSVLLGPSFGTTSSFPICPPSKRLVHVTYKTAGQGSRTSAAAPARWRPRAVDAAALKRTLSGPEPETHSEVPHYSSALRLFGPQRPLCVTEIM